MAILLPLAIIPTLIMGYLVYNQSRNLLMDQISERMQIFITEATNQLDSWLLDKKLAFDTLPRNPELINSLQVLSSLSSTDPQYLDTKEDILSFLREINPPGKEALFNYLMVADSQGNIIITTNRVWENVDLSAQSYYTEQILPQENAYFIEITPPPFYEGAQSTTLDVVLLSAVKITDSQGNLLGHIIGISNSTSIQSALEANSSFLPENNLFLINEAQQFAGITNLQVMDSLTNLTPTDSHLGLIYAGPSSDPAPASYKTIDGEEVLGIYSFFDPLNIGFIVETPESKILGAIEALAPYAIGIMAGASILMSVLIYFGAQQITNPLKELSQVALSFAEGKWDARTNISRSDEIGSLANAFNNMAEDLSGLYHRMEAQVEERTRQVITATEVSNLATNANNLDELLDQTADLISERFDIFHTGVFLLDAAKETAHLRSATSLEGKNLIRQGYRLKITPDSLYKWVIQNNRPKAISIVDDNPEKLTFNLVENANAAICVPIAISSDVFGFLDVQTDTQAKLPPTTVELLLTLANQLASAIQNFRLIEGTEIDLQQVSHLYEASQKVSQASTEDEIFSAIVNGVQQTSFFAAVYKPDKEALTLVPAAYNKPYYEDQLPRSLSISPDLTRMLLEDESLLIVRDVIQPLTPIRTELLEPARSLNAQETVLIPIIIESELISLIILSSRDIGRITVSSLQPFLSFTNLVTTAFEKIRAFKNTERSLSNLQLLTNFSNRIVNETDPDRLYRLIHEQIQSILGDVDFYIALYDSITNHIEIPYLYEGEQPIKIDPFPMGEGLTSIVVRTQQPLMLVENTMERAKALGAKIVGEPARSWIGIPLVVANEVIGVFSVQDIEHDHRFSEHDLELLETLTPPIAGAIQSARLLAESQKRAFQLQTSAEIAQETSTTLDKDELLKHAIQLVQDRFNFYHSSIFILDHAGEYAVVQESTGEAGRKMKSEGHQLKVGSKSVIGYVTAHKQPLVVNDVNEDPTHKFNPLLPDTRAELGIPILLGDQVLGALDIQSTVPYAFSPDDVEVLQILANQLAVAIENANLFSETQDHLAQHRLIHHVTTVAAASKNIQDALSSAVQGLRVTLGDQVSILLLDKQTNTLRVSASSGYSEDISGTQIAVGEGVTGWAAENMEAVIIHDVSKDNRYIQIQDSIRSEIAIPLVYRGELLGILNVESELLNAFDDHDQDILGTLAGSLSAIIVTARLSERQQQLFEITNKIRQSVNMNTILETTAEELTKALKTRRTRIQVGGSLIGNSEPADKPGNGKERADQ